MSKKTIVALAALIAASIPSGFAQSGRDHINIVGSSTVYPSATVVAEQYRKSSRF